MSLTIAGVWSQTPPPSTPTPPTQTVTPAAPVDKNAPEMSTKDAPALFKTRVNLVMVPVVVRDAKGVTVGTYTKDNFLLFDRGKPQEIIKFTVEKSGDKGTKEAQTADNLTPGADPAGPPDIPERFLAYLFDDIHLQFSDLVRARDAAGRRIAAMPKTERAAIFTTSGQDQIDFTDDQEKLHETLLRIRTRPISQRSGPGVCPDISYYMADQIINKYDPQSISLASQEYIACTGPNTTTQQAQPVVQGMAQQVLSVGQQETRVSLSVLKELVRRMSAMPGQRMIVLTSPGFLTLADEQPDKSDIIDRAIHANVMISSLDARGLWVDPMVDASQSGRTNTTAFMSLKQSYDRLSASSQADILSEMAYGTGGTTFQNNNDLDAGFRQLTVAPEYYYVLGFSPQNLKLDGSFHSLKVTVKPVPSAAVALQARKGYYAPKRLSSAAETAKEEIEEAVFSREDVTELPIQLHTQFFKSSDKDASIAVICNIDPKRVPFRKVDGRNLDVLTIVSAVFDRNGNFMTGMQKTVDLKLKDETLVKLTSPAASSGSPRTLSLKSNFSVAPGTYMVRLVVRDSEGQLMSALSSAVVIQ